MAQQVIQYIGVAHTRLIRKEDFEGIGVMDQGEVEFHRDSPITKGQGKVSLSAAEYLVANDSFQAVEPGDVVSALRSNESSAASGTDEQTGADETKPSAKSKRA
jgi:hypothetical protein